MRSVKLSNGFTVKIDEGVFDDMELLDALAEAQEEDPLKIHTVFDKVLGKEQKKAFYDSLRNEAGRVPTQKAAEMIIELFEKVNEGKNS